MNTNQQNREQKMLNSHLIISLLSLALFICGQIRISIADPPHPHILLIVVDDFGWSDIGYNRDDITGYNTPNIDNLISTGIELTNYYVHPLCTPTRAALLTGKYSFKNGLQMKDTILAGSPSAYTIRSCYNG